VALLRVLIAGLSLLLLLALPVVLSLLPCLSLSWDPPENSSGSLFPTWVENSPQILPQNLPRALPQILSQILSQTWPRNSLRTLHR